MAGAEASDLAVIGQRVGAHRLRLTLLSPSGASPRNVLIVAGGRLAQPCQGTATVCYAVPALGDGVADDRSPPCRGRPARARCRPRLSCRRPTPHRRPPGAETAIAFRNLRSFRAENHLASDAKHAVDTTYVVQAPDRLSIDVHGGLDSRIIGFHRWDRQAGQATVDALADPPPAGAGSLLGTGGNRRLRRVADAAHDRRDASGRASRAGPWSFGSRSTGERFWSRTCT